MKSCPYCNFQNDDDANFCVVCGKLLPETTPVFPEQDFAPAAEFSFALVENDTPFNQSALRKFYGSIKYAAITMLICGGILFLMGLLCTLLGDSEKNSDLFWIICGIAFIFCGIFYLFLYDKSTQKNKLVTETSRQLYLFDENGVKAVFSDEGKASSETYVLYGQITKVTKRKTFLLIWFGTTVWLVDRNAFTKGTEEDLKALLKNKCVPNAVKLK